MRQNAKIHFLFKNKKVLGIKEWNNNTTKKKKITRKNLNINTLIPSQHPTNYAIPTPGYHPDLYPSFFVAGYVQPLYF